MCYNRTSWLIFNILNWICWFGRIIGLFEIILSFWCFFRLLDLLMARFLLTFRLFSWIWSVICSLPNPCQILLLQLLRLYLANRLIGFFYLFFDLFGSVCSCWQIGLSVNTFRSFVISDILFWFVCAFILLLGYRRQDFLGTCILLVAFVFTHFRNVFIWCTVWEKVICFLNCF